MTVASEPSHESAPNISGWRTIGGVALIVSLILIVVAAIMRPTVDAPRPTRGLFPIGETIEVFDAGLMQQQMMLYLGGLFGLVLALLAFATASVLNVSWQTRQR